MSGLGYIADRAYQSGGVVANGARLVDFAWLLVGFAWLLDLSLATFHWARFVKIE